MGCSGARVKKEEDRLYLQVVSSFDICPAQSWYLYLESPFTLVGPHVVPEMLVGKSLSSGTAPPDLPSMGAAGL